MLFHFINSNIENQYEFVLRQWANDSEFAGPSGFTQSRKIH